MRLRRDEELMEKRLSDENGCGGEEKERKTEAEVD